MLYITALIYGKQRIKGEFKQYEEKAIAIFRKHGGEVIAAYAPVNDSGRQDVPDEVHLLQIADKTQFGKFINDPERIELADERDRVIAKTEIYISGEMIEY